MAYNKGLNKVTGTGPQTVDALKNSVLELDKSVTDLIKPFVKNEIVLTEAKEYVQFEISAPAKEMIIKVEATTAAANAALDLYAGTSFTEIPFVIRASSALATGGARISGFYLLPYFEISMAGGDASTKTHTVGCQMVDVSGVTHFEIRTGTAGTSIPSGTKIIVSYR